MIKINRATVLLYFIVALIFSLSLMTDYCLAQKHAIVVY